MAKKIKDEQGNIYVQKKPFYKKWWFILIAALIIISIIGGALGGGKKSSNGGTKVTNGENKKDDNKKESKEEKKDDFYKVGDSVTVGKVTYTLNSVELTDERNQFDKSNPAEVVKISYTVKNESDKDIPIGADVQMYGPDNKKAESYANEHSMGSLAPGKEMDCVQHFGINQKGEIEIQFAPIVSFKDAAKFKATVN